MSLAEEIELARSFLCLCDDVGMSLFQDADSYSLHNAADLEFHFKHWRSSGVEYFDALWLYSELLDLFDTAPGCDALGITVHKYWIWRISGGGDPEVGYFLTTEAANDELSRRFKKYGHFGIAVQCQKVHHHCAGPLLGDAFPAPGHMHSDPKEAVFDAILKAAQRMRPLLYLYFIHADYVKYREQHPPGSPRPKRRKMLLKG